MKQLTVSEDVYEKNIRVFLRRLTKLTKKHKLEICGCGCCGSPFLFDVSNVSIKTYNYSVRKSIVGQYVYDNLKFTIDKNQIDYGKEEGIDDQ